MAEQRYRKPRVASSTLAFGFVFYFNEEVCSVRQVDTILGVFDKDQAKKFKKAYDENADKTTFLFTPKDCLEVPIDRRFAKYFLEFLKNEKLV